MLILKENEDKTIIINHSTLEVESQILGDAVGGDYILQKNAKLYLYVLESKEEINLNITQEKDSYCEIFFINSAQNVNVEINLNDENCITNVAGVYNLKDSEKGSIDIRINHNAPNCQSRQNFRGLAGDKSRANIHMMSYVAEGAIKTEAYQLHKSIVLSDNAKIFAKPELEIYNDDVQCSHGNTVGNLDKQALFYLQSRGIDEKIARDMLIDGFLDEAVKNVSHDDIKNMVFDIINER